MYQHESTALKRVRRVLTSSGHHHGKLGGHVHISRSISEHADELKDKKMIESAIEQHEEHDHKGQKKTRLRLAMGGNAEGAQEEPRADRAPRGRNKGAGAGKDAKNHIAIVIAPQGGGGPGGGAGARPVPVPVPAGAGAGGPPPGPPRPMPPPPPPGGGAMPPGGPPPAMGGMGGPPPMGGPPMRKHGGRAEGGRSTYVRGGRSHGGAYSEAADMPDAAQQFEDKLPMKQERPEQEIQTAAGQKGEERWPPHRAKGGQVGPGRIPMEAGGGSGAGRLEKTEHLDYCEGGRR